MRVAAAVALCALAITAAGCGAGTGGVAEAGNATNGEKLFKDKCSSCHTLRAAGASGKVGPDLDYAFGSDYSQGFKEATIRQVVADQIRFAGQYPPKGPTMPQNIVTGQAVDDVATYVAKVAGFRKGGGTTSGGAATQPPATTSATTTTGGGGGGAASLAAGKKAFDDNGCGSCHTLQAAGSTGMIGPDLDKLKNYAQTAGKPLPAFIHESIVDPNAYVEKGFPQGVMPDFSHLPPSTVDALVKFLAASAKS